MKVTLSSKQRSTPVLIPLEAIRNQQPSVPLETKISNPKIVPQAIVKVSDK